MKSSLLLYGQIGPCRIRPVDECFMFVFGDMVVGPAYGCAAAIGQLIYIPPLDLVCCDSLSTSKMKTNSTAELIEFDNTSYATSGISRRAIQPNQVVVEFDPCLEVGILQAVIHDFARQYPDLFKTVVERKGKWYHAPMKPEFFAKIVVSSDQPWLQGFHDVLDADQDPLHRFVVGSDGSYLLHQISHSIADGHSSKMILATILDAYRAKLKGKSFEYPPLRFGLMKDHYQATRYDANGHKINKIPLALKGLWRHLTEKKLTRTLFSQHGEQGFAYYEFVLPDQIFQLLSSMQSMHPSVTLNDVMVTMLLHAYMDLDGASQIRYMQNNNVRKPSECFKVGNIIAPLNQRIDAFQTIDLQNVLDVSKDRTRHQNSPLSYQVVATYMLATFDLKQHRKLYAQYHQVPYCHMILSNMGSFPPKSYPGYQQLAQDVPISDYAAWAYQTGGLNTLTVCCKSPKGQKIIFASKAEPELITQLMEEVKLKVSAYVDLLVGEEVGVG